MVGARKLEAGEALGSQRFERADSLAQTVEFHARPEVASPRLQHGVAQTAKGSGQRLGVCAIATHSTRRQPGLKQSVPPIKLIENLREHDLRYAGAGRGVRRARTSVVHHTQAAIEEAVVGLRPGKVNVLGWVDAPELGPPF